VLAAGADELPAPQLLVAPGWGGGSQGVHVLGAAGGEHSAPVHARVIGMDDRGVPEDDVVSAASEDRPLAQSAMELTAVEVRAVDGLFWASVDHC
jgi:hypothetical protein